MTFKEKLQSAEINIKNFLLRLFISVILLTVGFLAGIIFSMNYFKEAVK